MTPELPRFRDPAFLVAHIESIMAFYHPRCIDRVKRGLLPILSRRRQCLRRDQPALWSVVRASSSTTRWQPATSIAPTTSKQPATAWTSSIKVHRNHHRPAATPGPSTAMKCRMPPTTATAWPSSSSPIPRPWRPGSKDARAGLGDSWQLLERHFWSPEDELYKDEISSDWQGRFALPRDRTPTCIAARRYWPPSKRPASPEIPRSCPNAGPPLDLRSGGAGWGIWSPSTTTRTGKSTGNTTKTIPSTCSVLGAFSRDIRSSGLSS